MNTEDPAPDTVERPSCEPADGSNENTYAVLTHLMPLTGLVVPAVGFVLGPIIWWALMKDKSPAVNYHGKEVLNLVISYLIYNAVSIALVFILVGIPLLILLHFIMIIYAIVGALKASNGELIRYPGILRFLK